MHRPVSSDLVVIAVIRLERAAQGSFTHDHNMVEAIAPDRSDEPFDMAILPRRAWCARMVTDSHGPQSAMDDCPVRPVAIPKEIARGLIPGECLGDLPGDPFRGRVCGGVGPPQAAPVQPHDYAGIEKFEAHDRHDEHVHGGDVWCVGYA